MNWPKDPSKINPFTIGDVSPEGSFVHVLDDVSLDIVMQELDTIRDLTDYLEKKEDFVRSGQLHLAHGEENLLAYYAIRVNEDGDHDFVVDDSSSPITIARNHYKAWISDPQYFAKKEARQVHSLCTDLLIYLLSNNRESVDWVEGYDHIDFKNWITHNEQHSLEDWPLSQLLTYRPRLGQCRRHRYGSLTPMDI